MGVNKKSKLVTKLIKKHVFIDANIWLSLYSSSLLKESEPDKLNTIKKRLQESPKVNLIITSHLKDEFYRNREDEILRQASKPELQLLSQLGGLKDVDVEIPSWAAPEDKKKLSEEVDKLRKELGALQKQVKISKKALDTAQSNYVSRFYNENTPADKAIESIFANPIPINKSTMEKAYMRFRAGNPPRKNNQGNMGDSIHWESLLAIVPNDEDLYITRISKLTS